MTPSCSNTCMLCCVANEAKHAVDPCLIQHGRSVLWSLLFYDLKDNHSSRCLGLRSWPATQRGMAK
jgi:hypothetical protein